MQHRQQLIPGPRFVHNGHRDGRQINRRAEALGQSRDKQEPPGRMELVQQISSNAIAVAT